VSDSGAADITGSLTVGGTGVTIIVDIPSAPGSTPWG
jgi:hypothetical protein